MKLASAPQTILDRSELAESTTHASTTRAHIAAFGVLRSVAAGTVVMIHVLRLIAIGWERYLTRIG